MRKSIALIASFCILALSWIPAYAQEPLYFKETGHFVKGEFQKFYSSNSNASFLYGYPITEQITGRDGKVVQYFQRARFELGTGNNVVLTPLGKETYSPRESLDVKSAFSCRAYKETGFSVCFSFLEFFDKYGGVAQFGYPISGFEYHENKLVQYFENTRLEWHPWNPEGQRVVVSDLGRVYFDKLGEDPALLAPVSINNAPGLVTKLQVRGFPWKAVTLANDTQVFYIILQDQNAQPVTNADCKAVVHWPNGTSNATNVKTNSNGVAIFSISFTNQPYGSLIYTDITCTYGALSASTTTSFRIWY